MEQTCIWYGEAVQKVNSQASKKLELESEMSELKTSISINAFKLREIAHAHKKVLDRIPLI